MARQKPVPGSKRDTAMHSVKAWLLKHPKGGSYALVAQQTGFTVQAVQRACTDLHLFDPSLVVSIPAPRNGYRLRAHWNETSQWGEGNQARHAATRLDGLAARWEKAVPQEADPAKAAILAMAIPRLHNDAAELRLIGEMLG